MTKHRLWIAAGVVMVFAGIAIVAFLRFPLGAVEEPAGSRPGLPLEPNTCS